ncbi:HTTM domain-containing protein [Kitasatospora sp. NPDC101155]|uniref:HTTM domain-containing protein n=1 Tax=Kitasatospora sp. NPDC101155 TaxID=3364097 RepID=UPI0038114970
MSGPHRPVASAGGAAPVPSPFAGLLQSMSAALTRGLARITGGAVFPYQSAVIRIGFSLTWLAFLLREWVNRDELYGPDSPWSWQMARQLNAANHAFTVLMWSDSPRWFEVVYAAAIAAAVMLLVGWRTRTASLLFMVGVLALQNRSVFEGDGGDNVIHVMAVYLVFTRCGQVWSLDARRARRIPSDGRDVVGIVMWALFAAVLTLVTVLDKLSAGWALVFWGALAGQAVWWLVRRYAPGEPRSVVEMTGNVVHAGAMLVIAVQVCFIYATAGWYKIQGPQWENGTALYYALHLNDFTPWPGLSHALAGSGLLVMLITYGTVIFESAFPFALINRHVKNVLLPMMMCGHVGIGFIFGLPFFALGMITADALFLPTSFLRWVGDRIGRTLQAARASGRATCAEQTPPTP